MNDVPFICLIFYYCVVLLYLCLQIKKHNSFHFMSKLIILHLYVSSLRSCLIALFCLYFVQLFFRRNKRRSPLLSMLSLCCGCCCRRDVLVLNWMTSGVGLHLRSCRHSSLLAGSSSRENMGSIW